MVFNFDFDFTNLSIIGQEVLFFFGFCDGYELCFIKSYDVNLHGFILVPQAWTVGLELAFYLIAPFILKRSIYTVIFIGLSSATLRLFWFYSGQSFNAIENMSLPNELLFFMMGAISYRLYVHSKSWLIPVFVSRLVLSIVLLMSVFYEFLPGFNLKLYVYLVLLMLAVPIIFKFSKENKIDRYIGELSYPLYISHIFVLMFTRFSGFPKIESLGTTTLIVTLIFSVLLYEFIAKPVEKYRQNRISKD
jgi:peptidoglycan/LPS O-acetylase OafA/YrhL